jgi:hypothetical protein
VYWDSRPSSCTERSRNCPVCDGKGWVEENIPPKPPTNLRVTSAQNGQIGLKWTAPTQNTDNTFNRFRWILGVLEI